VGLLDKSKMTVSTCSGGIKRRLNLAVALLAEPELLILDEPTVGVDPQSRNFIFEKILELKKRGVTLIYSTHYLEEVKRLCDHVAIVMDGQVKTQGTLNQVLGQDKIEERFLEITGQELDRELVQ
jgi:ABC-2 type transport system ATP-binding protein